jgi:uncharacterized circularly permuted ATP-grasp superfamily protein/uncharacterized alpha-E superfamily protein
VGGTWLHTVAFDLARGPDGAWWVVGTRSQAPSGLGYALQNRLIVSRLFPEAFREMRVQRLASSFRRLLDTLYRLSPRDGSAPPRIVILTPGPFNETYFEHAYLARYLGLPLVEGGDLTVRGERVFLKTLHGLERVHAILRRLDDDFCDPLELRPDSTLGVPGLLQAVRAGQVLVSNALGSGFLESPALNGFLPALCSRLLEAELVLPSLPSWWCGERAAFEAVADRLADKVVKPTYPGSAVRPDFEAQIGTLMSAADIARLRERIAAAPEACTVQDYLPLSQLPTWSSGVIAPRAAMVRVFAIADGAGGWHAMPGGLTRIASRELVVSMQRGGSSVDTWVRTREGVDTFSLLPDPLRPEDLGRMRRPVTSRAAENLFWMGRYAERTEFTVRLARAVLMMLSDDVEHPVAVTDALRELAVRHGLVAAGVPSPAQSEAVFERTLIAALGDARGAGSVAHNLAALARTGSDIRDRMSVEHWRLLSGAAAEFAAEFAADRERRPTGGAFAADEVLAALTALGLRLAAITGAQTDRMTRDDGWRLLTIGRQIERLATLAATVEVLFERDAVGFDDGFDLMLTLFDSTITYRSLYQRRLELPPLLDLLVFDAENPRALAAVVAVLRGEIGRLPEDAREPLLALLPPTSSWPGLAVLCEALDGGHPAVLALARQAQRGALALSDAVGARFFSHALPAYRSLAA